jgi:hypothetical protein
MTGTVTLKTRPLSPEDVLEGLRDLYTRGTAAPWEMAVERVTFDAPLEELIFVQADDSDTVIERYFGTGHLPPEWWERVYEFGTVGGLCHALAGFAVAPVVEPVTVYGHPDLKAGAFEVVKTLLGNAGADVSELRPSSPLLPYLWLWPDVFQWEVPRLAPGRVPELKFRNRRLARRLLGIFLGLVGLVFAYWVSRRFPVLGGLLAAAFVKLFLLDLALTPWAARTRNWSVDFGTLYDFRDLAAAIAGDQDRIAAADGLHQESLR